MALSLSDFRANVSDFARPNRFWVNIGDAGNNDIQGDSNADNSTSSHTKIWEQKNSFLAKSTSIPGRTIGNIVVPWQGQEYNIAGDPKVNEITITFHNSYDWDVRAFFEQWIESIAEMGTNERSQPAAYKTDGVSMQQLGRTEADVLKTYKLIGAYPTDLAAIDLSMDSSDQISEFTVTIKYDTFEVA
jgi:hypothetical protein